MKDNRLQRRRWSSEFEAMETDPVGEAANDRDYTTTNSPGSNTLRYEVPLRVGSAPMEDARGVDTPTAALLRTGSAGDRYAIDGWRLPIATTSQNVQ